MENKIKIKDGGVRWLVFNQKATENTAQPSNIPFQFFLQYSYLWLKCNIANRHYMHLAEN